MKLFGVSARVSTWMCAAAVCAVAMGCARRPDRTWRDDFAVFLNHLRQTAEVSKLSNEGKIDVALLNDEYAGKTVTWTGTLKYVRRGRPYFEESFVTLEKGTQMAAVMYSVDPEDVEAWEALPRGSVVPYTGVVGAVQVESSTAPGGFAYIELTKVKPVFEEAMGEE
jgi:hypothetical protein